MYITTNSEKKTLDFANKFSKKLRGGEIIGLIGELGAGKTIFTKGLASGLNIKKTITSPTFVLMKIYEIKNNELRIKNLVHIDAYRIKKAEELIAIGAKEYFNRPDVVTIIEWADRIKKILPKKTEYVRFNNQGGNKRLINL
ncbi:MAG: tRNA (adenosine(37)-N6)-threonylcarbamoyltransferase complex ATPase subunit type 1 TsaE [Patescibacteria group bacterium]